MSGDKLLQWTLPLPSSSGNSTKKMEVVEFRRSRDSDFNCMALSNSGALLAAATVDCIVTVWDLANNADG